MCTCSTCVLCGLFVALALLLTTNYSSATWPPDVRRLALTYMTEPFQVCVGSLDLKVSN